MTLIEPRGSNDAEEYSLAVWRAAGQVAENNVLNLVRLWAWSPYAQKDHQRLGAYLHGRTTVARQAKEIMIVRACTRYYGSYELFHHVPIAIASGLSDTKVKAIQSLTAQYSDELTEREKACVQYADELMTGRGVSNITWARLRASFSELECLELSLQTEYWSANARFTRTCGAPEEPWAKKSRYDMASGEVSATAENVVVRDASLTVDKGARVALVDVASATAKNAAWFGRWTEKFGPIPDLVRAWALNEFVQVAYQSAWESVIGGGIRLSPEKTQLVGSFVAWRNGSDHVAAMVHQTCVAKNAGLPKLDASDVLNGTGLSADESKMLDFVAAWDLGAPLGEADIQVLLDASMTRHEIVEVQLIAGLVGGQARIANALHIK